MRFEGVLFDLDGTLLDTVPDLAAATNAMLLELGYDPLPQPTIASYVGKGAENLIHRSLTGQMDGQVSSDLFHKAMPIWKRCYTEANGLHTEIYPGVLEGLDLLRDAGLPLGVVTNKPEEFALPLLSATGLSGYFQVIVGGDTCSQKKPQPMPVFHACNELEINPERTLFIGDSLNDAQAARAAACICWLLPYGYNEGNPVSGVPCDRFVQSIEEAALQLLNMQSKDLKS
ncbi:MAG: phosphoglycolate phosphatase [Limnobacter sp.]|nr:phosphoglycolate phosphatase [Limnobacter sp.]